MRSTLVILRHGESTFNAAKVFTGLLDADVTPAGLTQIETAAQLIAGAGLLPDRIITSPMLRAVRTTERLLETLRQAHPDLDPPLDVTWRLVERDYGQLTGLAKSECRTRFGEEAFFTWRRTLHGRPPAALPHQVAAWTDPPPVADCGPLVPGAGESLADVIERVRPFWYEHLLPLLAHPTCLIVVAHGNSLRALAAVIDKLTPPEVEDLNIPAGHPLVYELHGEDASPKGGRYLDHGRAAAAALLVAAEGGT